MINIGDYFIWDEGLGIVRGRVTEILSGPSPGIIITWENGRKIAYRYQPHNGKLHPNLMNITLSVKREQKINTLLENE